MGKHLEHLTEYERTPRAYQKQETDYWNVTISETKAKRIKICMELPEDDKVAGDLNIEEMTAEEIKKHL